MRKRRDRVPQLPVYVTQATVRLGKLYVADNLLRSGLADTLTKYSQSVVIVLYCFFVLSAHELSGRDSYQYFCRFLLLHIGVLEAVLDA